MLCLFCAPAPAQSVPSAAQYEGGSGYCPPNRMCVQSLGDGADAFSDNADRGTDAVNQAMEEPEASTGASTGASAVSVAPASTESDSGSGEAAVGPGGITQLPETGGAPLAALGSGMLLVTLGLAARGLSRR